MVVGVALLLAAASAHAQGSDTGPACWTQADLAVTPSERGVQRSVLRAFVAPPRRAPVAYSAVPSGERQAIRRVKLPPGLKLVALTFDLCEQGDEVSGYQGAIVDYLRRNRIKATFFAGGKWLLTHPERAQQLMADPLFAIGNHSWQHRNLRLLAGPELTSEIDNAQRAYEEVRGRLAARNCIGPDGRTPAHSAAPQRLSLFRFPFGACTPSALQEVGRQGLRAIQWDVSAGDATATAEAMLPGVVASVRPGSIVLFHANGRGRHTEQALPAIIEGLRRRGYEFERLPGA